MNHDSFPQTDAGQPPSVDEVWKEALDRMHEVASDDEIHAVIDISLCDADDIAAWREANLSTLTPQSAFFLNVSEAVKRRRTQ